MVSELHPQYLTDSAGNRAFVVLPVDEYEDLIENLHDLAVMAARRDEPRMSLDQFEEGLRNDGLL
jgi:PHD/YefM family antitoxin component YafN of YafNO toxin-antitoxin module